MDFYRSVCFYSYLYNYPGLKAGENLIEKDLDFRCFFYISSTTAGSKLQQ